MSVEVCKNALCKVVDDGVKRNLQDGTSLEEYTLEKAQEIRKYHASFPEYTATKLHTLPCLAQELGLKHFMLKDESTRFGLKAFKVLGASHAMGRYLASCLQEDFAHMSAEYLCQPAVREKMGSITFTSTTDGNHGRGLAWTAQKLQQKAVIFMPFGSEQGRVQNILDLGAQCTVTPWNYDETVDKTWENAQKYQHVLVQDTSWPGYEQIPLWIRQGYLTLGLELVEQLQALDVLPTHVFLQAGVGAFPAAMVAFFHSVFGDRAPKCIIMEPHSANCMYVSAKAADGKAHTVTGDLTSLMAGLACGKPCMQSWPILRDYATAFVSSADYIAANGMRVLAAPLGTDSPIVSGESGASTTGLVHWLMTHEKAQEFRQLLGLTAAASVLCISTEGDTVPQIYRDIVWHGAHGDTEPSS